MVVSSLSVSLRRRLGRSPCDKYIRFTIRFFSRDEPARPSAPAEIQLPTAARPNDARIVPIRAVRTQKPERWRGGVAATRSAGASAKRSEAVAVAGAAYRSIAARVQDITRNTRGIAEKRPGLPGRHKCQPAGSLAKRNALAGKANRPWLLRRSRIGPPVREVGFGNLAARPVLPWRSSGPVPHATLDTDANGG
jgi:hypothetical protein